MEKVAENDQRVMAIVSMALRQPPVERESYLRNACADNPALYEETAEAVRCEEQMGSFLQRARHLLSRTSHVHLKSDKSSRNDLKSLKRSGKAAWASSTMPSTESAINGLPCESAKPGFHGILSP